MAINEEESSCTKNYINRIKIRGFKSFKRVDLELPPGFIAVAGPNGSGKSNLSDSIRFALGELSLKALRARKTSELVFSDSKEAIVTLSANNENGIPIEVRRAIDPEGKTIYRLNGKKTTRTNILETIRPAGLELGNHNVIAQGQVQKIVEMSAKERRGILDGVAGISEFEEKKKESLRELDKVQQKINDASIVLSEREGFVNELEKEKDAALQYKEAKELFRRGRGSLIFIELDKLEKEYDKSIEKIKEIEEKLKLTKEESELIDKKIKEMEIKKSEFTDKINKDGKKEKLLKQLEELRIAINVDTNSLADKEKELKKLENEKVKYNKEKEELVHKLSILTKDISSSEKELTKLEKEVPKEVFESTFDITKIQNEWDGIVEKINSKKEYMAQLNAKLDSIKEIISLRKENLNEGDVDTTKLETEKDSLEKEMESIQKDTDKIFQKEKEKNKLIAELDKELIELRGSAANLRPLVKGIFKNPTLMFLDDIKSKIPGLYGTVAELVSFDQEYSDAVQGAVGGKLDYVIVEDIDTAAKIIQLLKKEKAGRCTFIPLDRTVKGENIPQKVKQAKGYVNSLINLVKFDPKFYSAMEYSFGSTAVVDNIDTAKKLKETCKIVTIGGEVFYQSGILTGGNSQGNLAAKMKLEKIEKTLENLKADRTQAYSDLENLREEINMKRKERYALELKYREIMIELGGITKSSEKTKVKSEDAKKALKELEENQKEYLKQISTLEKELSNLDKQKESISEKIKEARESEKKKQTEVQKQYADILSKISDKKTEVITKEKEKEMLETSLGKIKENEKQVLEDLKSIQEKKKELEKRMEINKKEHAEAEQEMTKISKKMESVWEEMKKLDKELEEIAQQKGKLIHTAERSKDLMKDYEISKAKSETRLIDLKAEFEEYKDIELLDVSREKLLEIIKENETKLNLLGEVNLKAPELYEEKKAEIEEVKEKVERLKDEKSAVLTMIDEIDSRKKRIFMETFYKINDKFKDLFGYVFEGEGLLVLDKPSDPFESGLQIKVKKGDRNKYLDSMSGGEKSLLALLFIFSIQMTKPSPFYLLDEAEAALDKENSKKMAELIKKLSKETQFLVITHNDEVLKSADVALGVTMTDKGYSQVLGIELNETKKSIE
ncbi:MAG: chromosome segregation protein SMC [Candidatus Micrarchaeia archaeon]|jgi:chromosome segregation protein